MNIKRLLNFIPAGSAVLVITTFLSYALGLVRDHYFANVFGASRVLDAYNAAFLMPDLLFNVLVASGIAAAFVPVLIGISKVDSRRASEYASSVVTAAVGTMIMTACLIFIFAGPISSIVAPGFSALDKALVAKILRVLSLSPILFGASNAIGAILVTKRRFLFYGLSPVLYNLGIILGTVFLAPTYGIMGVAYGTLGGAFLHLGARFLDISRTDFNLGIKFSFRTPEFSQTLKLMLPKMFGHPIELATFWMFTAISSTLLPGSVAIMSFARNFESVPVSLIGITVATTTFPLLAVAMADNSIIRFRKILRNSFLLIFFTSVLAAIVTYFIREPLVRIALGGGAFSSYDIARTAATLGMFTLVIPIEASIQLLARAFYATQNTITPVILNIIGFVFIVASAYLLVPKFEILALPLAFFIGSTLELILLTIFISMRVRRLARINDLQTQIS